MTCDGTPAEPRVTDTMLRPDCARCAGLCCVALEFARSADFPRAKPAGAPCHNLDAADRCRIYPTLRAEGWKGCTVFDCFGAGQQVTQVTFGGRTWRDDAGVASAMFAVFDVMRQLHEMAWHLTGLDPSPPAAALLDEVTAGRAGTASSIRSLDVATLRRRVGGLLGEESARRRAAAFPGRRPDDLTGADLIGADLRRRDLRGARLRSAYLVAADLRGARLDHADLLGADLRDTDLRGVDLSTVLFLTNPQLAAARGDASTILPSRLNRPPHWSATA